MAPAIASGFTSAVASCNAPASRGEATAQAQSRSDRPAHDSKDRMTTTLSSSRVSGKSENAEYSANRSSTTTYVLAREHRTRSAGERSDPNGSDGESTMTKPYSGRSPATSVPMTASRAGPRAMITGSHPGVHSATRDAVADGVNATSGPT